MKQTHNELNGPVYDFVVYMEFPNHIFKSQTRQDFSICYFKESLRTHNLMIEHDCKTKFKAKNAFNKTKKYIEVKVNLINVFICDDSVNLVAIT